MLHVLVYGAPKVGKTAWVDQILSRTRPGRDDYQSTIALNVSLMQWKQTDIAVIDAGSSRHFRKLAEDALHDVHVVVLMYDSTVEKTLDFVIDFYARIPLTTPVILVATTLNGEINTDVVLRGKTAAIQWGVSQYLVNPKGRSSCLLLLNIVIEAGKIPRQVALLPQETADEEECFPECCHPKECTIQ